MPKLTQHRRAAIVRIRSASATRSPIHASPRRMLRRSVLQRHPLLSITNTASKPSNDMDIDASATKLLLATKHATFQPISSEDHAMTLSSPLSHYETPLGLSGEFSSFEHGYDLSVSEPSTSLGHSLIASLSTCASSPSQSPAPTEIYSTSLDPIKASFTSPSPSTPSSSSCLSRKCSCKIVKDSAGRQYHEDALVLALTSTPESPCAHREWGFLNTSERKLLFMERTSWPQPTPSPVTPVMNISRSVHHRKCEIERRDFWADKGNPFLLTRYDFSPYRPFNRLDFEEVPSPEFWTPADINPSPQRATQSRGTRLKSGTYVGLGIFGPNGDAVCSRFDAKVGVGLGLGLDI